MTADEFEVYWARQGVEYVESLSASLRPDEARGKAEQDRARLLPDGLATDGQRRWSPRTPALVGLRTAVDAV